jgi:hypothetical protein
VTRTRFRRKADYAAVVLIVVASLTVGLTIWARSDIRHTVDITASTTSTVPSSVAQPVSAPTSLRQLWSAASSATTVPVATDALAVTANNSGNSGTVLGRDPLTGNVKWTYSRNIPLCDAIFAWSKVVSVFHKSRYCSEVTSLDESTGNRAPQRNGDAELGTKLLYDGTYITTTGPTIMDTWRSDLVRTMQYGNVPDFNNPNRQPRPLCTHRSAVIGDSLNALIETCPGETYDRLTVYQTTNSAPNSGDTPSVNFSNLLQTTIARVIGVNASYVLVAEANLNKLAVFSTTDGKPVTTYDLSLPATELTNDPVGGTVVTSKDADNFYWFTGSRTYAFSNTDFSLKWTATGTLGTAMSYGSSLLIPVESGLAVVDPTTGKTTVTVKVDRGTYTGPVTLAHVGTTILEQRGSTLVALG